MEPPPASRRISDRPFEAKSMFDRNGNPVGNAATSDSSGPGLSLSDRVRSLRLPDPAGRMAPAPTPWLPWLLCVCFAGSTAYFGYREYQARASSDLKSESNDPASFETTHIAVGGRDALSAGGYIIPVHRVQVSPKVGGEVVELFIEEGQFVTKGELLAKLDRSKYEYEFRRQSALADQAKSEYEKHIKGNREEEKQQTAAALREAEAQVEQLKDEAVRMRRSQTAASAEELFRNNTRLRGAEHKVAQLFQLNKLMQLGPRDEDKDKAKAAYMHACAQRDNSKYDLDNCDVKAPISGRILKKQAEVGNTVRPEAFSNGLSASLCEMADIRDLEVDVDVSEKDLESVYVKQSCEIRTEAFPNKVYKGHVARLMPEANRSKASVSARVHIDVPENDAIIRPEMRARVIFLPKK